MSNRVIDVWESRVSTISQFGRLVSIYFYFHLIPVRQFIVPMKGRRKKQNYLGHSMSTNERQQKKPVTHGIRS